MDRSVDELVDNFNWLVFIDGRVNWWIDGDGSMKTCVEKN